MIVTFYSFKGGVGRSMALVNVAELLADAGYKVLVCDWDLEAPGLERYFSENAGQVLEYRKNPGVIDLLIDYKETLGKPIEPPRADEDENFRRIGKDGLRVRNPVSYAVKVSRIQRQSGGWIKLLSAGRRDGKWDDRYTEALGDFDWNEFYSKWAGGAYIDFFRREVEAAADIILIDSRTGVTEAGGVCTHHLPDLVLLFSAANDQNVDGTRWMAEILCKPSLKEQRAGRNLAILPIASRIERNANVDLLTPFRQRFVAEFSRYLPSDLANLGTFIREAEIPYIAGYSFQESIVARQPSRDRLAELASPYEVICEAIVKVGETRELLTSPSSGQPSLRSAPEPTRITALIPRGQFVVVSATDDASIESEITDLRAAGLDVWSERDPRSESPGPISAYYDALERSAGRLLVVSSSAEEQRLNAEINSILARQAQKPDYRACLLMQPGTETIEAQIPLLRRLSRLELPAENLPGYSTKIVAALLPEPALIPEPDRDRLADRIGAKTEGNSRFLLGRNEELLAALSWLMEGIRTHRGIAMISGAAGEGKSAFIQAGVIPALRRGLLRPDRRPWKITNIQLPQKTLEQAMQILQELMSGKDVVAAPIALQRKQKPRNESSTANDEPSLPVNAREQRPAVVVDGIDTIALQHGWESEQIAKFLSTLRELQAGDPDILVLLATRSSFLDDLLQRVPNASNALNVYTLPRMKPEGMTVYLQGVTRLLGMRLEAGLVQRIMTDTDRSGVPSRSLRILIARLCEQSRGDLLTHEEYAAVGGIEGVTRDEIGTALSSISGSQLAATKALVTNLIHVRTGTRRSVPRDTLLKIAGDMDGSREALVQLFDWNVLATDAGDAVTLASDSIVKLDIVQQWIRDDYEQLELNPDPLGRYYDCSVEKAVAASQGRIGEGELRRWFGTALITPTGTRGLAFRGAPGAMWRIPGPALKQLEDANVIRREERAGTITHELTHDRFIEPIQKSNEAWFAQYQEANRIRAKLEEYASRESGELLNELDLREAEEYLNSPAAKILGATPAARQLVRLSRKELDEAKTRQAEELEEVRQRAEKEERLHKAESERVKLLLEKSKWERILGVTVFVFGIIMLIALAALSLVSYRAWRLSKQKTADLEAQRHALVEKGQVFREDAKTVLVEGMDPTRDVIALRSLSIALNLNRQDTEAAKMARNLLLQRVWCPPAAPEVRYRGDALLTATFAPGASNDEIFAAAGDGRLLRWRGRELSPVGSLFDKPISNKKQIVQSGFGSFSPDGQWLFIIPPTLVSAADGEGAVQGAPPQGGPSARAVGGHQSCKIQTWRWSMQNRTYESAGADLEIQRLRGSRINFAWSNDSDRLVLINARGGNEAECAFFELNGNTFRHLLEKSNKLNSMKIVALAFPACLAAERQAKSIPGYEQSNGIAVVSLDSAAPALRSVSFIGADDLDVIPKALNGQDSILLPEGFQPNGVAFGPGEDELNLTSWTDVRILDIRDGKVTTIPPPTFRDQFMRMVVGPADSATQLIATSLYGRVEVAKSGRRQESAEPVVFRGSSAIVQFRSDGQRLLILSGGIWNVFDNMRLIDVSPLYRSQEAAPENFEGKPVPPWLADIASTVSAFDPTGDGSLTTLEDVRKKYPESKAGDAYEAVWKRFFPEERTAYQR